MRPRTCGICNGSVVKKTAACVGGLYDHLLEPIGLSAVRYALLIEIRHLCPHSITELSKTLVLDRRSLSHILRPLERAGLIALTSQGKDERTIELTADGLIKIKQADVIWRRAQRSMKPQSLSAMRTLMTSQQLSFCPKRALFGFTYPLSSCLTQR